jgi:transposase
MAPANCRPGLTTRQVALRLRVGQDKVHRWVLTGQLKGINTASSLASRPRWIITPEALEEFEQSRRSAPAPKPKRMQKRTNLVDYYPD